MNMTNEQLELEAKDRSRTISWSEHWQNISLRIQAFGYSRTNDACKAHWRRVVESQHGNALDAAQESDDSSTRGTEISTTDILNDSDSSKRHICSENGATQTSKKIRVGDISCQEAAEDYHVGFDATYSRAIGAISDAYCCSNTSLLHGAHRSHLLTTDTKLPHGRQKDRGSLRRWI